MLHQLLCHEWNKHLWLPSLLAILPSSCHTALWHRYFKGWQLPHLQCFGVKLSPLQDCSVKLKKQKSPFKESRMLSKTDKSVSVSASAAIRLVFSLYLLFFFNYHVLLKCCYAYGRNVLIRQILIIKFQSLEYSHVLATPAGTVHFFKVLIFIYAKD